MPSGAKKRKAAKKKKQLVAQIDPPSSSTTSQGNQDVKNQDDKGSDSGEIDSPASQNHLSHSNPFGEGNKEIQESSSSNAGGASNVETNQKVRLASGRKNGNVQNESVEGSRDGDRSTSTSTNTSTSSSSSSSDAEDTTKKPEVLNGKTGDLVAPTASIVNSVTPELLASEETINVAESASVENTSIPDMIASKNLETAPFHANEDVTYVPVTVTRDLSSNPNQDRNLHLSDESVTKGSISAHINESPESFNPESEDQPLIEPRPPVPQRTSWLSCCGLCDIITGSNR